MSPNNGFGWTMLGTFRYNWTTPCHPKKCDPSPSQMIIELNGEEFNLWVRITNPANKIKFVANEPKPIWTFFHRAEIFRSRPETVLS